MTVAFYYNYDTITKTLYKGRSSFWPLIFNISFFQLTIPYDHGKDLEHKIKWQTSPLDATQPNSPV